MTTADILSMRLKNQQLSNSSINNPAELVSWLGAIQSQDLPSAKWALHLRTCATIDQINKTYDDGEILRTHVMRPTWHLINTEDILWMQQLTSQRVLTTMRTYYRNFGIDEKLILNSIKTLEKELTGNFLTRREIGEIFKKNGLNWKENGLAHIMGIAEAKNVITSGPMKGNQTSYALFNKRVTNAFVLSKEDAIAELVKRYFQSHGPALLKDFAWWSGLTVKDALYGIEKNKNIVSEIVDSKAYYFFPSAYKATENIFLLPNYDEYVVAYADREILNDNVNKSKLDARQNSLFNNVVIINGKVEGIWRKIKNSKELILELKMFKSLNNKEKELINLAAEKYGKFWKSPIKLLYA